jgi:hypothetical protein
MSDYWRESKKHRDRVKQRAEFDYCTCGTKVYDHEAKCRYCGADNPEYRGPAPVVTPDAEGRP